MSLIFDRTKRKNIVTRELYYNNVATQFQFLGDETVTVWEDGDILLLCEIDNTTSNDGWIYNNKYNLIQPDGEVE